MLKNIKKISIIIFASFLIIGSMSLAVLAEDLVDNEELIELATSEENISEISDNELLEAEPSELPAENPDSVLTERMFGRMLLDVEGNGEVYYVDPVTGGKEYLADGAAAYNLLQRRALGISEENFAKLSLGENKDDTNICKDSVLNNRLKGRIVIRAEANGEAYWIYPENCRAYYTGTFDAAYKLMRDFSLGINKANLAKIRNNARQRIKQAFRYAVYAYAEDNSLSLDEARVALENEIDGMKTCMNEAGFGPGNNNSIKEKVAQVDTCAENTDMPTISKERRQEIKGTIRETRKEQQDNKDFKIKDININDMFKRVRDMIFKK
ncbi:hypothetical protein CVU82_03595 [Candidatus Falkowbacteria bacterium HGW-Falkowbacteria-1]|uniref:Uncharacterized protein n=1 Tax=Candidatus Falkowbacteria bacterium HGW-Falkowbacteria-1 TaxID=2013768 RepID=A0A2N2E8X1_9BACT|nr:MAG: hypothetical protein CVU82_03595 [Candidatus Falkowbacteria bacterium HGW-Falkowbacteria-1]